MQALARMQGLTAPSALRSTPPADGHDQPRRRPVVLLHPPSQRRGCGALTSARGGAFDVVPCEAQDLTDTRDKSINSLMAFKDAIQTDQMPQMMIDAIRVMLRPLGDGTISISPYDTAWVALVKDRDGNAQFPSSVDWIIQNQRPDGSWGDDAFFAYDRIVNTLACVIVLKSWNIHADKSEKGWSFLQKNLWRLNEIEDDWMPVGYEITFPRLLDMANDVGFDMPRDEPFVQTVYAKRNVKLNKIPMNVLHSVPTTLLHNLEGFQQGLEWERLLKLQCNNGSFMASTASTAYALMQTGDQKCLEYLDGIVKRFNGAVPSIYPIEIFEGLWTIDRLERLGISRYFTTEIKERLDYVYRHWTPKGVPCTRGFWVNDIDDTAMGFRLLRLYGYDVSPCVFEHFEKDDKFFCYPGESNDSPTTIHNLYRAAQVMFPGEDVLHRASQFSGSFLQQRQASGTLNDKWVISKDFPSEVAYVLDFPWRASLPRIETRMYLEQYGGSNDVWITKALYRMNRISNDMYLELAKADFASFQRLCQLEWRGLRRWHGKNKLEMLHGVSVHSALRAYFLAAANIFGPNRAEERLAWARTALLAEAVSSHLSSEAHTEDTREVLVAKLLASKDEHGGEKNGQLVRALRDLVGTLAPEAAIADHLREAWRQWLLSFTSVDSTGSCGGNTALLLVRTIEICSGRYNHNASAEQRLELARLEHLTSSICHKLHAAVLTDQEGRGTVEFAQNLDKQVDFEMQELSECVLRSCATIDRVTRQTFLDVVKSFYYVAHFSSETIGRHISKVIFEEVI